MNKIKSLAVAVTLAVAAGSVHAQIATGFTGNGELFLSVWDKVGAQSYVRDLGVTLDNFGTAQAPASAAFVNTVDVNPSSNMSWGSDATWGTFTAGKTTAEISAFTYDVYALDHNGTSAPGKRRYLTTTNADLTGWATEPLVQLSNSNLTQFGIVDQYLDAINLVQTGAADTTSNQSSIFTSGSPYMGGGFKLENWGGNAPFNTAANVGTGLDFYYLTRSGSTGANEALAYKYGNAAGDATFLLADNGTLSYQVAAVPEAETWAMFGAGLLMVGAIARRRMAS